VSEKGRKNDKTIPTIPEKGKVKNLAHKKQFSLVPINN
jgi:hypothetical protein